MLLKTTAKKDIFYLMNKYSSSVSKVETEMLLEYLFNCSKLDLYVRDLNVDEIAEELYDSLINRRFKGEPVQHIIGSQEFMGLNFIVTKDVLIPRPETELLVNEACRGGFQASPYILDLCTGSGNIAVSIAKNMPQAEIIATDISEAALKIARKNAIRHNVENRIRFYNGDLFNALIVVKNPKFDIIVCNPPYIKESEFPHLQLEVKIEPRIALYGGEDGLDFYRAIAKGSHRYLKKDGKIFLEIGLHQADPIKDIFSSYNMFTIDRVVKDFNSIERVMCING
jgi:release factor glutamine methyltransferase